MIRKVSIIALAVALFLVAFSLACVKPVEPVVAERLTLLDSSVQAEFPSELSFSLSA